MKAPKRKKSEGASGRTDLSTTQSGRDDDQSAERRPALVFLRGELMSLALLHIHFIERSAQPSRQLLRVIISPEMHEEEMRRVRQHVAVERRHFNTVIA